MAIHFARPILSVLPGISGQVIEGTMLPSTPPQISHGLHGKHGPPQPRPGNCVPPPPPPKKCGVKGKKALGVGLGSVCSVVSVAIHSRPGACRYVGACFLTGTSFPGNTG